MIEIRVDGEPIGKGRHRSRMGARVDPLTGKTRVGVFTYPDPKTQDYETRIAWSAQVAMAGRPLLEGALGLTVVAYRSIPKSKPKKWREAAARGEIRPTVKPDFDNYAKIVDALNKVVWVDDAQIVDARIQKFYSDRPRLEIKIDNLS